ncbi:MAG: Arginine exporter protein ArgO [Alphaproteobacteria bacterium MarineAlpha5_Bin8]|nr:MAG: Arginine exporter protein ArgO [Alphaproteobacteria bacterium MarineAlpha5_Bin7]PPR48305.1 MAG: Arginine exporter protein ArgO [Alphaproteobacteria bacterium MarineAlpha5_Bin8]PPR53781.1 MAG: Arginine exporter protein ArgO [Alphaproteobacteria bacterium MarineAlpha5_Bin6]|tara:strand:+ start:2996 stop:3595 length:600 start_codon:yes stop_codon:yes gene_type:complete
MNLIDFVQGFIIASTLIIAIGPQNLFVINQGLKKKFIFITVLFCSLSDALLIILGINLSKIIINLNVQLIDVIKIIGGIWLLLYGIFKIYKSNKLVNIPESEETEYDLYKTLSVIFFITYANPHVYLDTVILIGSISSNFDDKFLFGLGAIFASFLFFFSLGYLSKLSSKYIYSTKTWFWIDLIFGILMIIYGLYFIFF